jgi:hypothetical protein
MDFLLSPVNVKAGGVAHAITPTGLPKGAATSPFFAANGAFAQPAGRAAREDDNGAPPPLRRQPYTALA